MLVIGITMMIICMRRPRGEPSVSKRKLRA
jgi:hypothetical protein